jgi:DNA-binding MarR family transcriptional regulator
MNIYSLQRKTRSDASAFESLQLFYQKLSIPQIAKVRKMTVRTVVKHLRSFIEKDVLHISNFTPSDQELLQS